MTDNGSHSYTEGSEPIKLTDEAGQVLNALEMTDDGYIHYSVILPIIKRYEDQLTEERNKAIQWCINSVNNISDKETLLKKLESLKSDSK